MHRFASAAIKEIPQRWDFGAASPAEARAKLEKLKLEAAAAAKAPPETPSKPEDEDAVARLAQKILRSSSIEEARQHARESDEHDERPETSAAVPIAEQGPGQGDARLAGKRRNVPRPD